MKLTKVNSFAKGNSRVVIFPDVIYLAVFRKDDKGNITRGYVINGDWDYEHNPETNQVRCLECYSNKVMNTYNKDPNEVLINIPSEMWNLNYNDVIMYARDKVKESL